MLFSDVTFGVYEGDKIGIVAQNGSGKTTLLNIICGKEDYDSGNVVFRNGLRIGYLEQAPKFPADRSILQNVIPDQKAAIDKKWDFENRAKSMLGSFGIHDLTLKINNLSGGQIKRIAIVKVLLEEPDILILDEPTNHLDIKIIEWLENYLTRQRVTLLMVTHDRYFLDNVCTKIIEIDRQQIFIYNGNFSYYLAKHQERFENLSTELKKVRNLLRTELEWMKRQPQARGSKAKYRIDNFHDLENRSKINLKERNVELAVESSYIGSKIFEAKNVSKKFGDITILKEWDYTFARHEKLGIVGENGVGKSTFIKLLLGILKPDSGYFDIGSTVKWGYYSQDGMTGFDEKKKVIDAVSEITDKIIINEKTTLSASQFLGQFLFTPEDQQKYIYKLSGGERRRLYLATVLMRQPNFLILDEPTNDLDIMTLAVLEDYLADFNGCVIVVSHDRFFLDRIADHLFVFKGNGVVKDFPGDYSTYRHCVAQEEQERKLSEISDKDREHRISHRQNRNNRLTFKEKKEMQELELQIENLGKEKMQLEEFINSGVSDHEKLAVAGKRIMEIRTETDEKEMRLLELMDKE